MAKSIIREQVFADIPEVVPTIGYFVDEEMLSEYNKLVDKDYQGLQVLKPFTFDEKKGEVVGSNIPGKVLLFQKFLRPAGYEMSRLQELEDARAIHAKKSIAGLDTSGYCYVDTDLLLRKNTERTADIVAQIAKLDAKLAKLNVPVAIGLDGLEVRVGGNLDGLSYVLTDNAKIYEAPIYAGKNKNFSRVKNGVPVEDKDGNRTVWNNDSLDIVRLSLGRSLDVGANFGDLAGSDDGGRVVLHRGGADGAKILQEYTTKQNANLQELEARLKGRYESNQVRIQQLATELKLD